jgi:hypothetical protein
MDPRPSIRRKFEKLAPALGERARRLWAGVEADVLGWGGVKAVADATGLAISTVRKGRDEVRAGVEKRQVVRERSKGGGRKPIAQTDPGIVEALDELVEPSSRGDPECPLRWSAKSASTLASELSSRGHPVSATTVAGLLATLGYSLQGTFRVKEGKSHPDRDQQFQHISKQTSSFISRGLPVISVDTKKKELIGNYANRGREQQPKGQPVEVLTYDFSNSDVPKAVPYGVYDVTANKGFVNVGTDHDTPLFAVHSIERWWELLGSQRYPNARELFITADSGGSNSRKSRVWKAQLQAMADRFGLTIHVSHYPPGTSKWNKIEHRLFSFISLNWRGRPLVSYETIVSLIAATKTTKGLTITAELDQAKYPLGIKITPQELGNLKLEPAKFHGEWNYELRPRSKADLDAIAKAPRKAVPTSHVTRREQWKRIIQEQRLSGVSISKFCRERGLLRNSFQDARRRILKQIQPAHPT